MAKLSEFDMFGLRQAITEVERVFPEVNRRVAPAELEKAYPEQSYQGVRVRGRWGTLRFEFILSEEAIFYTRAGLVEIMEKKVQQAVDNALAALVANEVTKQLDALRRTMKKYADDGFAVVQAELDRRPVPVVKVRWYQLPVPELWTRLVNAWHARYQ